MAFEIAFLDDPLPAELSGTGRSACLARITIGDFQERLVIPLDVWSRADYQRQWVDGLSRIVTRGRDTSALFTGMHDFTTSNFAPVCWLLYKDAGVVHVQNRWLPRQSLPAHFNPYKWYDRLPRRETRTPEGYQVSEWDTTVDALAAWRSRLTTVE